MSSNNFLGQKYCNKCGYEGPINDWKFCPDCGTKYVRQVKWDFKDQPNWSDINELLQPFGCQIIDIETGSDDYAVTVEPIK